MPDTKLRLACAVQSTNKILPQSGPLKTLSITHTLTTLSLGLYSETSLPFHVATWTR